MVNSWGLSRRCCDQLAEQTMTHDINLRPGWLLRDVCRATERLEKWQNGGMATDDEGPKQSPLPKCFWKNPFLAPGWLMLWVSAVAGLLSAALAATQIIVLDFGDALWWGKIFLMFCAMGMGASVYVIVILWSYKMEAMADE